MSIDNKSDRVNWVLKYMKKDHFFWALAIFSHEKRLCIDEPDGNTLYWANSRLERKYSSTRARGGQGFMNCAAISRKDKSDLVFVNGNLNSQADSTMVTDHFLSFIENKRVGDFDQAIFQQDNVPAHSAIHTKEWFSITYLLFWIALRNSLTSM